MKVTIKARITLNDKDGKPLRLGRIGKHVFKFPLGKKSVSVKCNSYVRQLIDILYGSMAGSTAESTKDTSNAAQNMIDGGGWYYMNSALNVSQLLVTAGVGDTTYGIQVGTAGGAITINDYHLNTLILNGNSATQLEYGSVSVGGVAIVGSTAQFTIARTMTNNSGADITVNEVGLVVKPYSRAIYFLVEHSLLTFTVTNGTSGTVTYTISVSV